MSKQIKINTSDFIFIIILLILIISLFYLIIKFNYNEELCSQNPLVYGVRKLGEKNNAELTCTCYFKPDKNPLIQRPKLEINKDEIIINYIGGKSVKLK